MAESAAPGEQAAALRAQLEEVLRLLRQKRTVRGFLSCALPQNPPRHPRHAVAQQQHT